MIWKDFFIESPLCISNISDQELRSLLSDLDIHIGATPGIDVGDGLFLNYCRISIGRRNEVHFDERAREAIERLQGTVVANSFEEVWTNYERSGRYFVVDIENELGERKRVPLSEMTDPETVVDGIARAPGEILGGPSFQVEIAAARGRKALSDRLDTISEAVRGSNELSDEEKMDVIGYLNAASAIINQANPDRRSLRVILEQLAKRVSKITWRIGERVLTNELMNLIKELLDGGFPF